MRALVFRLNVPKIAAAKILGLISDRAYLGAFSALSFEDVPEPQLPADDWVIIRTRYCGICGSDYKQVFADGNLDNPMTSLISFPQILGHEVLGTVVKTGPAARACKVGQRVVLNPWLSCSPRGIQPLCPSCADGNYSRCYNFHKGTLAPGIHTGNSSTATGGFAPLVPAHESMCIPVPDGVTDEQAVLSDPFSVSLHAVLNFQPKPRDIAVVYGCGTLGLLTVAILHTLFPETRVIAVCRFKHQQELARSFGAERVLPWRPAREIILAMGTFTGADVLTPDHGLPMLNGGVNVVYDTVGTAESMEVSLRICDYRARTVITGVGTPKRFEWTPLYFKEVAIIGSNAFGCETWAGQRKHAFEWYFDIVRSRGLDVTPIITHRFHPEQYAEAFLACRRQGKSGAVKVMFEYPG